MLKAQSYRKARVSDKLENSFFIYWVYIYLENKKHGFLKIDHF